MQQRNPEPPGHLNGIDMSDPENFEAYNDISDDYLKDTVAERKRELQIHRDRLARQQRNDESGRVCRWPGCSIERLDADPKRTRAYTVPLCEVHFEQIVLTGYAIGVRPMLTPPPPESRTQRQNGFIYYIRVGDTIKIGFASSLQSRLAQYPPNTVFLLAHKGTRADEKDIHGKLLASRSHGKEWYRVTDEVTAFIEQQFAAHGSLKDPRVKPKKTGYIVGARNSGGVPIH